MTELTQWIKSGVYLLPAALCVVAACAAHRRGQPRRRVWVTLATLLMFIGVNKQLRLQDHLTALGRADAIAVGWYRDHRWMQVACLIVMAMILLALLVEVTLMALRRETPAALASAGLMAVLFIEVLRAMSLHHADRILDTRLLGASFSWMLELSGIGLVVVGAAWANGKSRRFLAGQ